MPTRMLIVTLLEGHCRLPCTKPYIFLRRSQSTTNLQCPLTCRDLNGQQRLPWCPTPGANADNSRPEWEEGSCHDWQGTVKLALASFYLAKTHITTHNSQLIRPDLRWVDINGLGVMGLYIDTLFFKLPASVETLEKTMPSTSLIAGYICLLFSSMSCLITLQWSSLHQWAE